MRRVRFQLLAQVPEVDIYDVIVVVGIPPYALEQLGARKHATGMPGEREQEGELTRGQFDRLPVQCHFMLRLIDRQVFPTLRRRGIIR
jgi:hypothetical protein